jgi:hypothetical protein
MTNNKMTKRELAKTFRQAANRIDDCGWVKWKMGSAKCGYCIVGAIKSVIGRASYNKNFEQSRPSNGGLLSKIIPSSTVPTALIYFNDCVAPRSINPQREVTKLLRNLANGLEHGGVL